MEGAPYELAQETGRYQDKWYIRKMGEADAYCTNFFFLHYIMNKFLVEFLGTLFFLYVIIATGNALAIGAPLTIVVEGKQFTSFVTLHGSFPPLPAGGGDSVGDAAVGGDPLGVQPCSTAYPARKSRIRRRARAR